MKLQSQKSQFEDSISPSINIVTVQTEYDQVGSLTQEQPSLKLDSDRYQLEMLQLTQKQTSKTQNDQTPKDNQQKKLDFSMNTSLIGQLFLIDVLRLLLKAAKESNLYNKLTIDNLPQLNPRHRIENTYTILQQYLDKAYEKAEKKGKTIEGMDFVWIFLKVFKYQMMLIIMFNMLMITMKMISTFYIKYLIQSIDKNGVNYDEYIIALKLGIILIFYVVFYHNTPRFNCMIFSIFRNAFMKALYQKVASLSSHAVKEANVGKLINLVANDLANIEYRFNIMIGVLTTPYPLIVISFIIYNNYGFMGLIGLFFMCLACPLQMLLSHISTPYYEQKSKVVDERVKLTNEIIEGIRLIKMYAWEDAFKQSIKVLRSKEIRLNTMIQILTLVNHSMEVASGVFGAVLMFSLVYYYNNAQNLDIGTIFSILDLLQFLKTEVVSSLGWGIQGYFQLKVVLTRMVSIMTMQNSSMVCIQDELNTIFYLIGENKLQNSNLEIGSIKMENFTAYWKQNTPVLQDINLSIKKGECISIVGKVGSGKSSLLNCILKEIPYFKGNFNYNGRLAYVEQEPYIFNCSIKENITFGKEFDQELYQEVIKSCCLQQDIDAFEKGDETQIGERGINISGGQKARISLARAVYSQADIYLFDDPLSAVDAKVAKNLFFDVIKVLSKESTVLLTTHQIHFTRYSDRVLIFEDGQIKKQGTYEELEDDLKKLSLQLSHSSSEDDKPKSDQQIEDQQTDDQQLINETEDEKQQKQTQKVSEQTQNSQQMSQSSKSKEEDDLNEKSRVTFQTYKFFYKQSSMPWIWFLLIILFTSSEFLFIAYNKTLGRIQTEDIETLFRNLWWIVFAYFINQVIKNILIVLYFNNSALNVHEKMINSLFRATVQFFDLTASGKILNLFSTDIGLIDGSLVTMVADVLEIIIQVFIFVGSVAFITPYFIFVGATQLFIIIYFVKHTKNALFHTKQLDLNQRAPVFTFFNVVVSGVLPIRVYKQSAYFEKQFNELGNNSLRATWYFCLSSRGFGSQIHLYATIANAIGIFVIISVLSSPSLIGQAIVFFMGSTELLQWGIRQLIQTDVTMSSAQRCKHLVEEQSEPLLKTSYDISKFYQKNEQKNDQKNQKKLNYEEFVDNENEWFPSKGQVTFKNVQMRYRSDLNLVLKDLSFTISPGKRVGFVGRTGAGKSSIIQAIFRMTETEDIQTNGEEVIKKQDIESNDQEMNGIFIDGHNIKNLGLHTLRGGISIIPQVPFVFQGTIRHNLDPLNLYDDKQIEEVLADIQLLDKVNSLDKKLYTDMTNTSQIFSTGQKQLICLGRAILRQSKLIVLDEATANCDMLTDELIQQKIRQRFENSTIITVAHRLNTIADYDQIIVIDKGQAVEQGTPYELLQLQNGHFYQMVEKTGKKNSSIILQIAQAKFNSNYKNLIKYL